MKNDLLANRHIGISKKDEEQMLRKIGVSSLDELIDKTIPANIRLKEPLALPEAMTEYEFGQHIAALAAKNKLYTTYIGMGWYNTVTPAVIQRNVFENPVWYTSYTPYQTEVSQGRLEAPAELPDRRMRPHRHAPCQLLPAGRGNRRRRSRNNDVRPAPARYAEVGSQTWCSWTKAYSRRHLPLSPPAPSRRASKYARASTAKRNSRPTPLPA